MQYEVLLILRERDGSDSSNCKGGSCSGCPSQIMTIRTWHAGVHAALHRLPGTSQYQPTGTGERGVGPAGEKVGIRWAG